MTDIIHDSSYSMALCALAETEGLLSPDATDNRKRSLNKKVRKWVKNLAPSLLSDIVVYDRIALPDRFIPVLSNCDSDFLAVTDTYDIPQLPKSVDQEFISAMTTEGFLRHAIQLKPLFIHHVMYTMSKEEGDEEDNDSNIVLGSSTLWNPIIRGR